MAKYCPFCVARIDQGDVCPHCNHIYTYKSKPHHLKPGTLLNNKYLVGRVLGEGGFGITYVGRDLTLDMKVAIKEYYPKNMAQRSNETTNVTVFNWSFSDSFKHGKEKFILEAQTIAKMDKESAVVTVRDFFEQNNSAYIVMEFVEGHDLKHYMAKTGKPLDKDELLELVEPVFGALGELHSMGLIHRDISPDNIMVEKGRARLIDFGCARETMGSQGDTVLKHSFSPLEQYRNQDMGPWTDVYAMAATIYYCITGKLPPRATDRAIRDELVPPSALGIKMSAKQEKALMKGLALHYEDRYQSMAEFGKDLFIHRNKYKFIAIAACAAAVIAVAGILLFGPGTRVETMSESRRVTEVYTISDNISADEKEMLEQVSRILEDTEFHMDSDGYYIASIENKSDYNMNVTFSMRAEDSGGVIVVNTSASGGEWPCGSTIMPRFYSNYNGTIKMYVRANINYNDKSFRTEFVPVELSSENIGFSIELKTQLPFSFTYKGYSSTAKYTISSFDFNSTKYNTEYSVDLYFGGIYESGPSNEYGYMSYRLLNENGAVVSSGNISISQLNPGDRFENVRVSIYEGLPAGNYTLELSERET